MFALWLPVVAFGLVALTILGSGIAAMLARWDVNGARDSEARRAALHTFLVVETTLGSLLAAAALTVLALRMRIRYGATSHRRWGLQLEDGAVLAILVYGLLLIGVAIWSSFLIDSVAQVNVLCDVVVFASGLALVFCLMQMPLPARDQLRHPAPFARGRSPNA